MAFLLQLFVKYR